MFVDFDKYLETDLETYHKSLKLINGDTTLKNLNDVFKASANLNIALLENHFPSNDGEKVLQFIGVRLFNQAMLSYREILMGYYQASFATQRDIIEIQFLLDYFRTDKSKVREWKVANNKARQTEFSPSALYKKLDARDGFVNGRRKKTYQELCEYAAHVTYPGMTLLVNDNNLLVPGGFFNAKKLSNTFYSLARYYSHAVASLAALISTSDRETINLSLALMDKAGKVFKLDIINAKKFVETKQLVEHLLKKL